MAKALSQVYTAIRGSVGGITYTANQFQPIVARARVSPVNPQSANQTRIRSAFSTAVNTWNSLTQAQRDDWHDYAQTLTYQGPIGSYTPTGRQVFLGTYATARYLAVRGLTITPGITPPVTPGFLTIDNLNIATSLAGETALRIAGSNLVSEDFCLYAEISNAMNPARNYWTGPYEVDTLDEVILSAPASGQIDFTGLQDGMKYFARVRAISDAAPHRMSNLFHLGITVVTGAE